MINSLIAQKVDAIAISANDPDALVPALKKAMERGITVISWDSGVAPEGRQLHLNPSRHRPDRQDHHQARRRLPARGRRRRHPVGTSTATNQNTWIEAAKKALPEKFPNINLVATVYGDDDFGQELPRGQGPARSPTRTSRRSSRRPRSASSPPRRSSTDAGLIGKVNVTGLGLPSEFKQFIDNGASQAFALWNPIDLGYSAVYLAYDLAVKKDEAKPGAKLSIGRIGEVTLDDTNSAAMADPFTFDKSNIEEFSKIF